MKASRGSSMILAILILGVLVITVFSSTALLRAQARQSAFQKRIMQAHQYAQAGLQDAYQQLQADGTWRTGFSNKTFKDGYYNLSFTGGTSRPTVNVTGYAASMAYIRRPFRSLSVKVDALPVPQMSTAAVATGNLNMSVGARVDSYNSDVSPDPVSFSSTAVVYVANYNFSTPASIRIAGNFLYRNPNSDPGASYVTGTRTRAGSNPTEPTINIYNYDSENDNLTGLSAGVYSPSAKTLVVTSTMSATITTGVYYVRGLTVHGTLTANITNGPVVIFVDGSVAGSDIVIDGGIVNPTHIPGNLVVWFRSATGRSATVSTTQPLDSALYFRLASVTLGSTLYGNIWGDDLNSPSTGLLHQDLSLQRGPDFAVRPLPGTWTYNAKAN